jgi:hypothetical protein
MSQAAWAGHQGWFHRHISTYVYFRITALRRIDSLTICFVLPCDLHSATSQLRSRASSLSCLPRWQDEFPTNYPSRTAAAWSIHRVCIFICRRRRFVRRYGVAGCVEENWSNLSLEETSAPSPPLDKDMSGAVLVGIEFDLTSTELFPHTSASMEGVHSPPSSIMDAYASDGTLTG